MKDSGIEGMLLEIRQPLANAFVRLSPHSSGIHRSWSRLLRHYAPCGQFASGLRALQLAARCRALRTADPQDYRKQAEHEGQDLARRGVPAECVTAAISLYVESCVPYLAAAGSNGLQSIQILVRWASIYQFLLLSGYSRHEAAQRISLVEKIGLAERRVQAFSIELANAYETERRRLARDLHDEIGHDLIVLKLYTQVITLDLKKGDIRQVRRKLRESVSLIKHALESVRHLTFDLGPAVWKEQGFVPAVRFYVHQFGARTGLKARIRAARLNGDLPAHYETALYKVLQGALSNIAAHAEASRVGITLQRGRESVIMRVEDDGKGFNVERTLNTPTKCYGLRSMRDRIELLGGTIQITSWTLRRRGTRHGTTIEFRLPFRERQTP